MKKSTLLMMTALTSLSLLAACSTKSTDKDKMADNQTTMADKKMDDKKMDDKMHDKETMSDDKKMDDKKSGDKMMNKGEMAPDFNLKGVDGKTYKLSDFKGKKVYLKFWASWCSICLSTLGDADKLAAEAAAGDDLVVLSVVSPNHNGEKSESEFKSWFSGLEYKHLPVALDTEGSVLKAYGVLSYPTSAFIGSDGVLVKTHIGFMAPEDIKATIKDMK